MCTIECLHFPFYDFNLVNCIQFRSLHEGSWTFITIKDTRKTPSKTFVPSVLIFLLSLPHPGNPHILFACSWGVWSAWPSIFPRILNFLFLLELDWRHATTSFVRRKLSQQTELNPDRLPDSFDGKNFARMPRKIAIEPYLPLRSPFSPFPSERPVRSKFRMERNNTAWIYSQKERSSTSWTNRENFLSMRPFCIIYCAITRSFGYGERGTH